MPGRGGIIIIGAPGCIGIGIDLGGPLIMPAGMDIWGDGMEAAGMGETTDVGARLPSIIIWYLGRLARISSSEMSSSGCTSLIAIPELDSGFLMVGAADIVAFADIDVAVETEGAEEVEYAGKVGRTIPEAELIPGTDIVGLKSGPTGADDSVTFV